MLACRIGEGITGRAALTGEPQLVPNVLECEFAQQVSGTREIDESIAAVPLSLRRPHDRSRRRLQARHRPVRPRRRPLAGGARGPCVRRARERPPLRGSAPAGRGGVGERPDRRLAARVQPGADERRGSRGSGRADRPGLAADARRRADQPVAAGPGERKPRLPRRRRRSASRTGAGCSTKPPIRTRSSGRT